MADSIKNENIDKDNVKAPTGLVDKMVDGLNSIAGEDFTKSVKTNVNDTIHNFQETIQKPVESMISDVKGKLPELKEKLPKNFQDVKDALPKNMQEVRDVVNTKTSKNIFYSMLVSFAAWKLLGLLRKK